MDKRLAGGNWHVTHSLFKFCIQQLGMFSEVTLNATGMRSAFRAVQWDYFTAYFTLMLAQALCVWAWGWDCESVQAICVQW